MDDAAAYVRKTQAEGLITVSRTYYERERRTPAKYFLSVSGKWSSVLAVHAEFGERRLHRRRRWRRGHWGMKCSPSPSGSCGGEKEEFEKGNHNPSTPQSPQWHTFVPYIAGSLTSEIVAHFGFPSYQDCISVFYFPNKRDACVDDLSPLESSVVCVDFVVFNAYSKKSYTILSSIELSRTKAFLKTPVSFVPKQEKGFSPTPAWVPHIHHHHDRGWKSI